MPRLKFTPGKHQELMIQHALEHPRCSWWAGMGMGKTSAGLTVLEHLDLVAAGPTLVLAPLRVAKNVWPQEAEKWEHLRGVRVSPVVGSEDARIMALRKDAGVYTINYENLPWLIEYLERAKREWPFTKVIADEATRLKSFRLKKGGQRARAIARVAHTKVKHWINLTGTPSPNGLKDLWGQQWFIDAGARLGRSYTAFKQRWFRTGFNGFDIEALPFADAQIHDVLRDVCITLDPKDYFDIKEPLVKPVYVDLPARAMVKYKDMERKMFAEIDAHQIEAFNAAARTIKCLQLANGAAYVGESNEQWVETHDAKLQALESIAEEAGGMPILVAYHFKSDLARLKKAFPEGRAFDANPQTVKDFAAGKIPKLFIHPASGGHGVDGLQYGTNIIAFFGHWWDLEQYQQVIERIGPVRQKQAGFDRPVWVYPIIARGTVDELVMARRESKREVQDLLLDAMKRRGS